MTEPQFSQFKSEMKEHIEDVIQSKVNGKIDTISRRFDAFLMRAEPALRAFENVTWAKKVIIGFIVTLGSLAVAYSAISNLIRK